MPGHYRQDYMKANQPSALAFLDCSATGRCTFTCMALQLFSLYCLVYNKYNLYSVVWYNDGKRFFSFNL